LKEFHRIFSFLSSQVNLVPHRLKLQPCGVSIRKEFAPGRTRQLRPHDEFDGNILPNSWQDEKKSSLFQMPLGPGDWIAMLLCVCIFAMRIPWWAQTAAPALSFGGGYI
jgi:hypothetical protein